MTSLVGGRSKDVLSWFAVAVYGNMKKKLVVLVTAVEV